MSRFFRLRRKSDQYLARHSGGDFTSIRMIPPTELHPSLASLPHFTPSPIQFAEFPDAEAHAHELVARFLHAAYPRAPTAEPPKTDFSAMFDSSHSMSGKALHKSARRETVITEGTPFIHAHGPGVWMPQVLAKAGSIDTEGNRLALLLPDAGKSGVHVPGRAGLPPTTWEFRQLIRDVRRTPSNTLNAGGTPYGSLWICRPLTPEGQRQRSRATSALELEVGIWVLFTREPDWQRKEERLRGTDVKERVEYMPPKEKGVGPAHVALAKALMKEVDADRILPKVGWTASLRPQGTYGGLALTVHHAHLFVPCTAFHQQTIMYALPEAQSTNRLLSAGALAFSWEDENTKQVKKGSMRLKWEENVVGKDNLVKEAKWAVGANRDAPSELKQVVAVVFVG